MIIYSSYPERFWGEATLTTMLLSIDSNIIGNVSPYEHLYKVTPYYTLLKVLGSACFVLLQPHEHTKLETHA